MNLAALQHEFAKALHYQSSGEACDIVSDAFSADERIQIYRNNFIIGLSEVLQASYPTVQALLGEECFLQIARQHVLSHPLSKGDVSEYGEQFEHSLQQFDAVMQAAPYCAEMARFEWAQDISQQRFNRRKPNPVMPLAQLATLTPQQHEQIQFHLHSDVVLFASQYALFSLRQAIDTHDLDGFVLDRFEHGVIHCTSKETPCRYLLSDNDYQLLQHIQTNVPLNDIPAELLNSLNVIITLGFIAGFTLPEHAIDH